MPSITDCSISVSSRTLLLVILVTPFPPKRRSIIEKVMEGSISRTALPFNGSILITASVVGDGIERVNSS